MPRLGVSKKKKSPRDTELSQLKKELKRVTEQLESRDRELAEASEREAATSDILRVIASSPDDLQPVLEVVAKNAARLCGAADALIYRLDDNSYRLVASHGSIPVTRRDEVRPLSRGRHPARAMMDRATIHIHDVSSPEAQAEFPESWAFA